MPRPGWADLIPFAITAAATRFNFEAQGIVSIFFRSQTGADQIHRTMKLAVNFGFQPAISAVNAESSPSIRPQQGSVDSHLQIMCGHEWHLVP